MQATTSLSIFTSPIKSSKTDDLTCKATYDLCPEHIDLLESVAGTMYGKTHSLYSGSLK